ncbi:glycosidase [Psychromonas sp. Urea-02u-13]|nr:glycosidase [Psychromonas sp. Urea-02u-13]
MVVKWNTELKRNVKTCIALAIAVSLSACVSSDSSSPAKSTLAYACDTTTSSGINDLRMYQVMVESFVNGDDSIGHGTGYGTSHHNGDIQGIIDSLEYIQSLGVNAIWLTPIFDSTPVEGQDHWADRLDATGYYASNYFAIDPRFGSMEKAKELVEEAHKRGLYVFFDGVFGHHKDNVSNSPQGNSPQGKSNPVSYPESMAFYKEVATYWITELKIDGWRLDQAYQVPTDAWAELRKSVDQASKAVTYINADGQTVNPLGYMVAEIWNNENYINETGYGSAENPALCSAFDFPVRYRIVETFAVNENSNGGKGGEWLDEGMSLHSLYPAHAKPNLMLGNHDLVRFGDLLQRGKIADIEDDEYWQRHKAALSFQAAYTGPITLYYGDEIGDQVEGFSDKEANSNCAVEGLCDDHVARSSAKIDGVTTGTLTANQDDLKMYVSKLMKLRAEHPALSQGKRINVLANSAVYVDHKQSGSDILLYLVSTQSQSNNIEINASDAGSEGDLIDLVSGESFSINAGKYQIPLNGFEARFLAVQSPSTSGATVKKVVLAATGSGFMASCSNPTLDESGPINNTLYVVGDFANASWKHKDNRSFEYKGDNVYQVVVDEKAGSYRMQYASKDWSSQFTADGFSLKLGVENALIAGGYGTDTAAMLPEVGKYVWSLQFSDVGLPEKIMVSKCQ